MTYLQLAQRLQRELNLPGSSPTTVVAQTGGTLRLVEWIASTWEEIQLSERNWRWMRTAFSFNTVASKTSYHPTAVSPDIALTRFSHWVPDSFRIYLTSSGKAAEIRLTEVEYDSFRNFYLLGPRATTYGQPITISVGPDRSLHLGLGPNAVYTVSGDYQKSPQVMTADTDVPEMPEQFHMLIVYSAMINHGFEEAATEILQRANMKYSQLVTALRIDQLPPLMWGVPLIS